MLAPNFLHSQICKWATASLCCTPHPGPVPLEWSLRRLLSATSCDRDCRNLCQVALNPLCFSCFLLPLWAPPFASACSSFLLILLLAAPPKSSTVVRLQSQLEWRRGSDVKAVVARRAFCLAMATLMQKLRHVHVGWKHFGIIVDRGGPSGQGVRRRRSSMGVSSRGSSGRAGERRQEGGSLVVLPMAVLKLSIDIIALS